MTNPRINGLRSIELAVHDLKTVGRLLPQGLGAGGRLRRGRHAAPARHRPRSPRADAARTPARGVARRASVGARPRHGRCAARPSGGARRQGRSRAAGAREERGRRLRLPRQLAGGPSDRDLGRRRRPRRRDRRPHPADQAHPRRHQQRRGREADRVLPRRARLQVERQHRDDGLRALLHGPSQRRDRARQRARASTTWPTRCPTSTA